MNKDTEMILQAIKEVGAKVDGLEQRMDRLDQRMDESDKRFDRLEQRMDESDNRFDRIEKKIDTLVDGMEYLTSKFQEHDMEIYKLKQTIKRA